MATYIRLDQVKALLDKHLSTINGPDLKQLIETNKLENLKGEIDNLMKVVFNEQGFIEIK